MTAGLLSTANFITRILHEWVNGRHELPTEGDSGGARGQQQDVSISNAGDLIKAILFGVFGQVGRAAVDIATVVGNTITAAITTGASAVRTALLTFLGLAPDPDAMTTVNPFHELNTYFNWVDAPMATPSERNKRSLGFDASGTMIAWLESETNFFTLHGGGSVDADDNVTDGKVLLTFGNGRIGGDTTRHAVIKLDDGVLINKKLKFEAAGDTSVGDIDQGIGFDSGRHCIIKSPSTAGKLQFYRGGTAIFEAHQHGIKILHDAGTLRPDAVGDMRRIGNDVMVYSGGQVRNLSTVTAAAGPVTPPPPATPTYLRLPVAVLGVGSANTGFYDQAFGRQPGCIGMLEGTRSDAIRGLLANAQVLMIRSRDNRWLPITSLNLMQTTDLNKKGAGDAAMVRIESIAAPNNSVPVSVGSRAAYNMFVSSRGDFAYLTIVEAAANPSASPPTFGSMLYLSLIHI